MSQSQLEALAMQEDIKALREIIAEDPNLEFIRNQTYAISNEITKMLEGVAMPALDLSETSIKQANEWLRGLQTSKDKLVFFHIRLDEYEAIIQDHWSKAFNITMIQPAIEGLRSNDQRNAYIEQLFEGLCKLRRSLSSTKKKIQILEDNLETGFHNLQQQQRNLQLVAQASRFYGNPS